MNRRWIVAALFVVTLGAIAAVAIWGPDGDWGARDNRAEVVQVVDVQGNAVEGGNTIVIERDRHFFPFGLFLIPLAFFLFFGLFRWAFRGPGSGGPWGPGGDHRAQWLDEWHARQHQGVAGPPVATPGEPS